MTKDKLIILPDFMLLLRILFKNSRMTLVDMQKETGITYAHLHKIKGEMINRNWINQENFGVHKFIFLTDKGKTIAGAINVLLQVLDINDNNMMEHRRQKTTSDVEKIIKEVFKRED